MFHALRKGLEADVDDIIISIGDDDQLGHGIQTHIIDTLSNDEKKKVSIVRDSIERRGPLGGLYSALAVGMSPAYAVMAVDMPFMPMDLYYDWLYQVNHNNWNVIVPTGSRGKPEPMAGIYMNGWDAMNPGHFDQHLAPFYEKDLGSRPHHW